MKNLTLAAAICLATVAATPAVFAQGMASTAAATAAASDVNVVYHVDDAPSMRDALNNITVHVAQTPRAHIKLLANGRGVVVLTKGEGDRQGEYADTIGALQAKGVQFIACQTAMRKNNITESALVPGVSSVPSGVVELTRLQLEEHHAYIKP